MIMRFALDDQIVAQPGMVAQIPDRDVPRPDPDRPPVFTGIGTSPDAARAAASWVWLSSLTVPAKLVASLPGRYTECFTAGLLARALGCGRSCRLCRCSGSPLSLLACAAQIQTRCMAVPSNGGR